MARKQLEFQKILLLLLYALHQQRAAAVITYPQCDEMSVKTICACRHEDDANMKIVCALNTQNNNHALSGDSNTTLTIVIYRSAQVRVHCRGLRESKSLIDALPALNIGPDLMLLVFSGCHELDAIMQRFGIYKSKLLELSAVALATKTTITNTNLTRMQLPKALPVDSLKLNAYTQFAADLFVDYAQLKFLDIQADNLVALPLDIFQPLPNLIGLTLKAHIAQLPLSIFRAQRRLINIVLSDGALPSMLNVDFQYLIQLQSLHLPRNELTQIPAYALASLTELLRINLSENRLRALPATMFAQQKKLISIDLSENLLQELPANLFAHTHALQELRLSHNKLQRLPSTLFAPLNYMKVLLLNNNQLRSLAPQIFASNNELQRLHLQYNQIALNASDMCATFAPFKYMSELLLRSNALTHICEQPWMRKMGLFDLAYNRIEVLRAPALVALACSWARVDLSHNALQSIVVPARIASGKAIQALTCRSNISLNYNALHCDCHLLDFVLGKRLDYLNAQTQLNTTNLSCDTPIPLRGRLVDTLQPGELLCPVKAEFCAAGCRCWARTYDATLIVNCTRMQLTTIPALPSLTQTTLTSIELHLTDNNITVLPLNTTSGYANVTRLYAARNLLRNISATQLPAPLMSLDVRHNRLTQLSASFYSLLNDTQTLSELYLSHNAWECDCTTEQLLISTKVHYNRIRDLDELRCANTQYPKILELAYNDICPADLSLLFTSISLLAFGFFISIASALYFKYQLEINVWLYAHNVCLWCVSERELDKDKLFDAFISYSHKDESFVVQELLPGLEQGDIAFRVCTHERNWLAGAYIPEQIIESVEQSCRTIIVLSQHFIESPWARMEFRTAHQSALNEGRARIIIIMLGEVTHMEGLDTELQAYLKMNTYLKWNDPWFWSKLRYAMPHKRPQLLDETNAPRYVYSPMELKEMGKRARDARHI
ncbi:protein toll-like [Ceratitis capitata]|uniref:protein toll-like n=1 Tax=Ceratitis capitata TaxID=7213 RepID=UPI0003298B80|nr:protein toll-like [Ceratitis capitata]